VIQVYLFERFLPAEHIPCQNKLMSKGSSTRQGIGIAFRLGTELVVATMIGALMGYAMDNYFDTKPWGILVGLIF